ncbi:MAG TPA: FtsX-like permease family protein [Alphaproteobacteria bacterium]|nr:FtsX-like permease family protein [Alphaproteobacteria bacterium]
MSALAVALARRELRGGLRGFRIFLACLALGVMAVAAVQSLAAAVRSGLDRDGRALLGGDLALSALYTPIAPPQRDILAGRGDLVETANLRAMARRPDGESGVLVELKAVSGGYPLVGAMELADGTALDAAGVARLLGREDGRWGALVDQPVLDRLELKVGDTLRVNTQDYVVRGAIAREPDRAASGGFLFGPRLLAALPSLEGTGLLQPGSLVTHRYLLALDNPGGLESVRAALAPSFPDDTWRIRDRTNAAPQVERFIDRLAMFLTLVGLAALLVGGVGVGNAVRAFMDSRRTTIATLKCLGAPGGLIFRTYFIQILALSGIGIGIGLLLGALLPVVSAILLAPLLPVRIEVGVYPGALTIAAAFGVLVTVVFSLWPLGRAREVPASALFRAAIAPVRRWPRRGYLAGLAIAAAALAGLAIATAHDKLIALGFVLGAIATLAALRGAAWLLVRAAGRWRPKNAVWRLAVANLHRPGNLTADVMMSLGVGLTVLVGIAAIEGNFTSQVEAQLPERAPSFFFIDIQQDQVEPFRQLVAATPGAGPLDLVPMLRGRIVRVRGQDPESQLVNTDDAWVLRGDRGLTYAKTLPEGSEIVAGQPWAADYSGEPLLSVAGEVAGAFGLSPGDTLTISVLGRDIEAKVANVRNVNWQTLGVNFAIIFSPGLLESAPHTFLGAVKVPEERVAPLEREIGRQFPSISVVRVKDALAAVGDLIGKIGTAVRAVAAVTLVAGALVLAGAIAAGHRRRVYDAVVLKVLGATRRDVGRSFLLEYGLLGALAAALAAVFGTLAAWAALTRAMELPWTFLPASLALPTAVALGVTLVFGFAGTWRALGQKAAPLLRND